MNYTYKIHVINRDLNLDPTYKNVVQVFNPLTKTKDYTGVFTNDELTFTDDDEDINFDLNDGINASVVLDIEDNTNPTAIYKRFGVYSLSMQDALNRQYCIIQETKTPEGSEASTTKLYFYFIMNYSIRNSTTIKYTLQLDAFMTYPLYSDVDVNRTKILRAHTNRFTNASIKTNATLNFNNRFLETGEETDAKYIKINKGVENVLFDNYGTLVQYLGEAVPDDTIKKLLNKIKWLYVETRENDNTNRLYFAPIIPDRYDTNRGQPDNKHITNIQLFASSGGEVDDPDYTFSLNDAEYLYNAFAEEEKVINAFISPLSPFGYMYNGVSIWYNYSSAEGNQYFKLYFNANTLQPVGKSRIYYYSDKGLNYIDSIELDDSVFLTTWPQRQSRVIQHISFTNKLFETNMSIDNTPFNYDTIKKAEAKTKMRKTYNEYILKNEMDATEIEIDPLYIKNNNVKVQAFLNLDLISNGETYITINDLYNKKIGAYIKPKYTPQFYSDTYEKYKANNHNYELTGIALPMIKTATSGLIAGGLSTGGLGAIGGALVGLGYGAIQAMANYDDMKNSPDAVKRKGEAIELEKFVNDYPFFIEHSELRDEELKAVNMYFYEYGYTINEIDEIKNFFTRSSFNYIQTEDAEKDVHALLNKNILDVIIKSLNNGVRFWTKSHYISDKFEYSTNNLESSLL